MGASSLLFVASYPLFKRVTYWPQIALGKSLLLDSCFFVPSKWTCLYALISREFLNTKNEGRVWGYDILLLLLVFDNVLHNEVSFPSCSE